MENVIFTIAAVTNLSSTAGKKEGPKTLLDSKWGPAAHHLLGKFWRQRFVEKGKESLLKSYTIAC